MALCPRLLIARASPSGHKGILTTVDNWIVAKYNVGGGMYQRAIVQMHHYAARLWHYNLLFGLDADTSRIASTIIGLLSSIADRVNSMGTK